MKIYELRCFRRNHESYEDFWCYESAIGFYASKELAENAIKNLDVLKNSGFESAKIEKEHDQEYLDEENSCEYYENELAGIALHHNYVRGFKIFNNIYRQKWDFLFEVVEHELIES